MWQMFEMMKGGGGWGGKGGKGGGGWGGKGGGGGGWKKEDPSKKVWVGNIPEGISQEEIAENFKQAGTVVKANLTTKTRTGIIQFSTAAEAKQAIAMFNGSEVGGATLHVDEWTSK